jgi:tellurite resistance protein
MGWLTVLAVLFALIALTALVSWLVLYVQFCNSAEKRWRGEVIGLLADAERQIRSENQELRQLKADQDAEARSLREKAFGSYLDTISVNELEVYPGIGPVTVGKLRGHGYNNLTTLRGARIRIHGLREKRLSDIDHAVRDLLWKARSTFDAGACQQARALSDQLNHLPAKYNRLEVRARARAGAAEVVIDRLQEPAEVARQVTFWRWFRPISNVALVSAEFLDSNLPDLDAAVRDADAHAARGGARRWDAPIHERDVVTVLPVDPPPAIPVLDKRHAVPQAQAPGRAPPVAHNSENAMPDEPHLLLMELTIQFALGVARADGPVTWTEREWIRQHILQRFSYNRALLNRAEAFCAHYETAAIDLERCLGEINRRLTDAHRAVLMAFAGQIVAVSGGEAARAAPFLQDLAQRLGVPPVALSQPKQPAQPLVPPKPSASPSLPPAVKPAAPRRSPAVQVAAAPPNLATRPVEHCTGGTGADIRGDFPPPVHPVTPPPKPAVGPTPDECLALLEIPSASSLSADLVRRQWNLLSERLAPERVASMGPEFVKLAETKRVAFRGAAETLLEAMGEKLESKPPKPTAQDLRHNPDLDDVFGGM